MSRYLSRCVWVFASFLAPSAAASTLANAVLEAALLMPPVPPKAGEAMTSQVALHYAGRRLREDVSDVDGLKNALDDASIDHIYLKPGTYTLSETLEITRSVKIEADPGTVVLDASTGSSRVLKIDAEATMAVELIGLNITGGYPGQHVSARPFASDPWPPWIARRNASALSCCRVAAYTSKMAPSTFRTATYTTTKLRM